MNAFPMIAKCMEQQWNGLPKYIRESIIRSNDVYDGSHALSFGQVDYVIWASEISGGIRIFTIPLLSVKEEYILHDSQCLRELEEEI